ncbi:ATP-binding protein [Pseudoalteromonas neustonica]|uniref:ATP-binding protein n=1 Tax=Pseudoalteromonas neustonica TaxID=1840331 RepID=UPI0007DB4A37|nr:ATP-binding protein [Pseudoalteromonas neustonica]
MSITLREPELKFGKVKEVDGSSIILYADFLERKFGGTNYCAEVGAYVNCGGANGNTICTISKVQITEIDKTKRGDNGLEIYTEERRVVTLSILGCDVGGKFNRGVKRLPTINYDTYFLSSDQVNQLIGINLEEDKEHFCVTDKSDDNQTYLNLDKLMGRHTAILGTTGSGKSCTVASIVQSILSSYECPRILFFDIHNEYPSAFGYNQSDQNDSFKSRTNAIPWSKFSLPYWFLDLDEFFGVYNIEPGSNQKAIIKKIITQLKVTEAEKQHIKEIIVSADTPIFFSIDTLLADLKSEKDSQSSATAKKPYESIILKIEAVRQDTRYSFLHSKMDDETSVVSV